MDYDLYVIEWVYRRYGYPQEWELNETISDGYYRITPRLTHKVRYWDIERAEQYITVM